MYKKIFLFFTTNWYAYLRETKRNLNIFSLIFPEITLARGNIQGAVMVSQGLSIFGVIKDNYCWRLIIWGQNRERYFQHSTEYPEILFFCHNHHFVSINFTAFARIPFCTVPRLYQFSLSVIYGSSLRYLVDIIILRNLLSQIPY